MALFQLLTHSAPTETPVVSGKPISPEFLQDLLEAALNVARVDASMSDAKSGAPPVQDVEARKWHDVSLRALSWTRTSLIAKQDSLLKEMLQQANAQGGKALSPMTDLQEIQAKSIKPSSLPPLPSLSPDAAPFRPGPPGVWKVPCEAPQMSRSWEVEPHALRSKEACEGLRSQGVGSLREDLMRLREYEADCCIIVRQIKKLGLESANLLRQHFTRFGDVAEVLVAHSIERKSPKSRCDRIRPAALGFIIMSNSDAAKAALSAGPTLEVENVQIGIKQFEAFEDDSYSHDEKM